MSGNRKTVAALLHPLFFLALLFVFWESIARLDLVDRSLLPPVTEVFAVLFGLLQEKATWEAMLVTGREAATSYLIAAPVGIAIGLFLEESKYWGAVFKPFFYFLFSIPKSVFLPMFILAIGIGFTQKVAFGVFSTIFIVVISVSAAVRSVTENQRLVARCYGATPWQVAVHVYFPSMLPSILETLRLAMIFNFTGIMLAEMYVAREGMGYFIGHWGQDYLLPQLLAGVIIVATAAILFNELVRFFEKRYGHWRA